VNADRRPNQKARDRFPGAGLILAMCTYAGDLPDVASFFLGTFFLGRRQRGGYMRGYAVACDSMVISAWGRLMYFVAAVLAVLAGLFYAAGNNEIGSLGGRCANTAARFAITPPMFWPAPYWPHMGRVCQHSLRGPTCRDNCTGAKLTRIADRSRKIQSPDPMALVGVGRSVICWPKQAADQFDRDTRGAARSSRNGLSSTISTERTSPQSCSISITRCASR